MELREGSDLISFTFVKYHSDFYVETDCRRAQREAGH